MIKHIVLFQLKGELSVVEKQGIMKSFREDIMALIPQISIIRHIEVGFNVNPGESWDICLNSAFDSLEDLHTYATHPLHLDVSARIKPFLQGRSCADYEI